MRHFGKPQGKTLRRLADNLGQFFQQGRKIISLQREAVCRPDKQGAAASGENHSRLASHGNEKERKKAPRGANVTCNYASFSPPFLLRSLLRFLSLQERASPIFQALPYVSERVWKSCVFPRTDLIHLKSHTFADFKEGIKVT